MKQSDLLAYYDAREAEIHHQLASIEKTQIPRAYHDVLRTFNRELAGIEKRRQLFGAQPSWVNESEETPQQNKTYTLVTQPRTLASYFEEETE